MTLILRQSTSVVISFGPFVDKTDGVTPETGLVSAIDHATTGILLSKNGGALTIRSQAVTASTYDAYGMYRVTLSTTDTNTVGTLRMAFIETATCLPVWQDFQVVEEEVYDDLYAASAVGYLKPTTAGRDLDVSAGGEAGVDWANVGTPGSTVGLSATTIKEVTDVETKLGTPVGVSVSADIVTAQADLDNIQTRLPAALVGGRMDSDIGAKTGNVPLSAQEKLDVNTEADTALADVRVDELVGASAGGVKPVAGSVMDQVMNKNVGQTFSPATDSLEALRDTEPMGTPMRGTDNAALASVATEARLAELDAANMPTDLANIEADTQDIQGRLPAGLVGGRIDAALDATGLEDSAVDKILDEAIAEPAGVFAWGSASLRNIVGWLGALSRNKITQTNTVQTLRDDADGADIGTAPVSDDGVTATRGEWT